MFDWLQDGRKALAAAIFRLLFVGAFAYVILSLLTSGTARALNDQQSTKEMRERYKQIKLKSCLGRGPADPYKASLCECEAEYVANRITLQDIAVYVRTRRISDDVKHILAAATNICRLTSVR